MRLGILIVGAWLFGCALVIGQTSADDGALAHVRSDFEFVVHGPYKTVAPLFGPEAERAWGGGEWNPVFLYPQPARDIEGAVFTVQHGGHRSVWVNTAFDLASGHV